MTTPSTAKALAASYYEAQLVELPTLNLFAELGWATANLYYEVLGAAGTEGRESEHEVILRRRLLQALKKINPGLPDAAYAQAIEQLTADRSTKSAAQANREFYDVLRNRVRVRISDADGNPEDVLLSVLDWANPEANDFLLVQQFWVSGDMYRRRCDLVGFVNGIPLVLIELKKPSVLVKEAFDDNLSDYKVAVPQLFVPNALVLLSNGSDTKVGSLTAAWEHFFEWKRINDEGEQGVVSLETAVRGLCDKARLLDVVQSFIFYEEVRGGLAKKIAKNHQYLGVNRAIEQVKRLRENQGRLGVFWHTQGSGKSLSMAYFAEKIHRTMPGNWTFVIVTDRDELDGQISGTFKRLGIVPEQPEVRATSGANLKELLLGNHRYIFTLIQKFRAEPGQSYPILSNRSDIIVITDEAHRSQYDVFALNMRSALPNAAFIGFTGTPLLVGEERTKEVFGDYVSVYNFSQSIEDGATVPLYYENRIPELQLTNENLNEDIARLLEEAELDEAQEKRLEREFGRQYHLITRDERLETIAGDLVTHFTGRGYRGKAMFVCIDKATAVRMYDKVQKDWTAHLQTLRAKLPKAPPVEVDALRARIALMETTDMAVVVSQGQNEIEELKQKGLDITPHRKRMVTEDLDEKFKNPDDPLRLVFVCAMWITGFDVPTCSTIYLDKPMKNHTLMQTIARANRVAPGKASGLIVDYAGIFHSLQNALSLYARPSTNGGADVPIKDKTELVKALAERIVSITGFCTERAINLSAIGQAEGYTRIGLIDQAVDTLIAEQGDKKQFLAEANHAAKLYKAILPDAAANHLAAHTVLISFLAATIRSLEPAADISTVMNDVEQLLNDSIATDGYRIGETPHPEPLINLSEIDFAALQKKFDEDQQKHSEAEKLKRLIAFNLTRLVRGNRSRIDFLEKFQQLIDEYNSGSRNIESFFQELMAFANNLSQEEQRTVAERLSEEELAVFDILTRPEPPLSSEEREAVKAVAKELLVKLKSERLVIDWRQKLQAKAAVQQTIAECYRKLPSPSYTRDMIKLKRDLTFGHIFDCYAGVGRSVYSASAP